MKFTISTDCMNWRNAQAFYDDLLALGKNPRFKDNNTTLVWDIEVSTCPNLLWGKKN